MGVANDSTNGWGGEVTQMGARLVRGWFGRAGRLVVGCQAHCGSERKMVGGGCALKCGSERKMVSGGKCDDGESKMVSGGCALEM